MILLVPPYDETELNNWFHRIRVFADFFEFFSKRRSFLVREHRFLDRKVRGKFLDWKAHRYCQTSKILPSLFSISVAFSKLHIKQKHNTKE